jgi:sirohydrochlorin ferrochelatase
MRRTTWTAGLLTFALTATAAAQSRADVGTLVVAHGGGPEWDAQVLEVARQVRTEGPVEVAFLMGPGARERRFQDAVARLVRAGADRIVVVPLLVSSHSGHYEQVRYLAGAMDSLDATMRHHLHMAGIERPSAAPPMVVTPALDSAAEMAEILAERYRAHAQSPGQEALLLVGHGPNDAETYAEWMRHLRAVAAAVRARTGAPSVLVELVRDDAPPPVRAEAVHRIRELVALQHAATRRPVVVVPILVARGRLTTEKLARDLAGLPIRYAAEGLAPHPALARWIERQVRQAW